MLQCIDLPEAFHFTESMKLNFAPQMRKLGVFSSSLIVALSMILIAGNFSASQSSGTSVTTCYNKKTGAMRYLIKGKCSSSESTLRIDRVAAPGARGATGLQGPVGPTGPAGAPGYSSGLSVSDFHDDSSPSFRPTVPIANSSGSFNPTVVFRTDDISDSGASSSDRLLVTSDKLVQVSASLIFNQVAHDDAVEERGQMSCNLFRGLHGANIADFQYVTGSGAFLDISETSVDSGFMGSMTLIGWMPIQSDSVFAVKCIRFGPNPSDVRLSEFTLNAIAIG